MLESIIKMFSYSFLVRAFVAGTLISLCASLLGVNLVLKRYSMIGDGLSHVGFGALAIATALNVAPLSVAIPVVIAAAFLLLRITESSKIKADAAIALIATGAIAIGVMVISMSSGMNVDVFNYMFGSILAMNKSDMALSVTLSIVVILAYLGFYNKIFSITFDESFAKATGLRTDLFNMLIALLTAITIVLGMRLMGSLLISAIIIFPSLSAMRAFKSFKGVTIAAALISVFSFISGITISYFISTPTGASVVLVNIFCFLIMTLVGFIRRKKAYI